MVDVSSHFPVLARSQREREMPSFIMTTVQIAIILPIITRDERAARLYYIYNGRPQAYRSKVSHPRAKGIENDAPQISQQHHDHRQQKRDPRRHVVVRRAVKCGCDKAHDGRAEDGARQAGGEKGE